MILNYLYILIYNMLFDIYGGDWLRRVMEIL